MNFVTFTLTPYPLSVYYAGWENCLWPAVISADILQIIQRRDRDTENDENLMPRNMSLLLFLILRIVGIYYSNGPYY